MHIIEDKVHKTYLRCGILIGLFLSSWVLLTYVVFPTMPMPTVGQALLVLLILALMIIRFSYLTAKNSKDENASLKVAILTTLTAFSIMMLTLILVDNIFLNIVSQQPDRIAEFEASNFTSMRVFTNWKLLKETFWGTIGALIFGCICGLLVTRKTSTFLLILEEKLKPQIFSRMSITQKSFFWLVIAYFLVLTSLIAFNSSSPYSIDKTIYVVVPFIFLVYVVFLMGLVRLVWNLIRYRKFFPNGAKIFIANTCKFSAIICFIWLTVNLFSIMSASEYEQMFPMGV